MNRDIIIGDIHGCWAELERLLDELAVTDDDRVISVGDLVDRGPDSERVADFFRTRPNAVAVMGNHERKHVRGVLSYSQEIVRVQMGPRYEAFRAWAAELPYFLETPDVIVVHGGFEDGVPLAEQREDVLSATTSGSKHLAGLYGERYWPDVYSGDKPIAFGHHIVGEAPQRRGPSAFALDTGACHGGWLSALVVPGFTTHRVKASRDYWREAKRRWEIPVLEARPWASFKFKKLARELGTLRGRSSAKPFTEALERWLAEVDALIDPIIERVEARHSTIAAAHPEEKAFRKAAGAEPNAPLLFSAHAGTLDRETVVSTLSSPDAILRAARRHGLPVPPDGPWV